MSQGYRPGGNHLLEVFAPEAALFQIAGMR
jgi:hypothetical protein